MDVDGFHRIGVFLSKIIFSLIMLANQIGIESIISTTTTKKPTCKNQT